MIGLERPKNGYLSAEVDLDGTGTAKARLGASRGKIEDMARAAARDCACAPSGKLRARDPHTGDGM
jgi:hypothetical protein